MLIYGVGNHTPEQFITWLKDKYSVKDTSITILPFSKKLKEGKSYTNFIILTCYADFVANRKIINSKVHAKTVFILFANPFRLHEHDGIIPLDCSESTVNRGLGYSLSKKFDSDLFKPKVTKKVERKHKVLQRSPYLPKLVNNVHQECTILSALTTVIYTIKGTANQKPATLAIAKWLTSNGNKSDLDAIFKKLATEHNVIQSVQYKLRTILLSELGDKFKDALAKVAEDKAADKAVNYTALERDYGVNPYDVRYILSIISNAAKYSNQEKKSIDSLASKG